MAAATKTIAIQYEDFNPNYEWKEEQASNILLLHLPEFQKEEMKITYVHSSRVIRVTEEKPITNKKWRRFNKSFPVPDNCNVQKIQAKFQTPTLTITLPKITPSNSLMEQKNDPIPQTINDHQHKHQDITTTTTTNRSDNKKQDQENLQDQEKPQKKDDTDSKKIKKQDQESLQDQERSQKKDDTDSKKIKKQELNPSSNIIPKIPPTQDHHDHEEEKDERKKKKQEEEDIHSKKRKELLMLEEARQEIMNKKIRKEDDDEKKKLIENYGEKAKEVKKRIMEFGKEMTSEDKQSLINVGVAILVIAVLGVYFYSSSSSSSSNPTSKD